ncbi:hypothetical protein EAO76_39880 [Streptomyces sp. sk2.1]|nr:hypothetical protein EAO76_39880 [Streptomyces sp. sk2.1]
MAGGPDAGLQCSVVPGAALPGPENFLLGGDLSEGVFGFAVPAEYFDLVRDGLANKGARQPRGGAGVPPLVAWSP